MNEAEYIQVSLRSCKATTPCFFIVLNSYVIIRGRSYIASPWTDSLYVTVDYDLISRTMANIRDCDSSFFMLCSRVHSKDFKSLLRHPILIRLHQLTSGSLCPGSAV